MKIYFDTCCYSRPFDSIAHQEQFRVRQEVTAIMDAVKMCGVSGIPIIGSAAVDMEIEEIRRDEKRGLVRAFYLRTITEELIETAGITARAQEVRAHGISGELDSYHVAFAEAVSVDFLLTTDDRFENAAGKLELKTKVINPINFLGEYFLWLLLST